MKTTQQIVEEQVQRWNLLGSMETGEAKLQPVITISREAGSGGRLVAQRVAETLQIDLFHQEVIHEMAKNARMSGMIIESLDEKALNVLEDYIASVVHRQHLWPDQYLKHLLRVIGAIGRHGKAVLVGRGANFVLPPEGRLRVRITAPKPFRVQQVAGEHQLSLDDAESRITRTDSDRRAFIRKYFHSDIADPLNYDLVLNTGTLGVQRAAAIICDAVRHG